MLFRAAWKASSFASRLLHQHVVTHPLDINSLAAQHFVKNTAAVPSQQRAYVFQGLTVYGNWCTADGRISLTDIRTCAMAGQQDNNNARSLIFRRVPDSSMVTRYLFVGNCSPALGMSLQQIKDVFHPFCPSAEIITAGSEDASHVYVVMETEAQAAAALKALDQQPCPVLENRKLMVRHSIAKYKEDKDQTLRPVAFSAEQLGVPGLQLIHDFITEQEETALLQAVQSNQWHALAKRRVQHYGWEFDYSTRSFSRQLGPLPAWVQPVADRISHLPAVDQHVDQLTVNEYTPGVGLSPHVDTHSAFTGAIVSLSLGSDTVMELRKDEDHRPVLLPRRSLLVLAGESRYAWQHYIPHRKMDELGHEPASVQGAGTKGTTRLIRGTRVSLTFRQIRGHPCDCAWPEHCDSRQGGPLPTRIAALLAEGVVPEKGCSTSQLSSNLAAQASQAPTHQQHHPDDTFQQPCQQPCQQSHAPGQPCMQQAYLPTPLNEEAGGIQNDGQQQITGQSSLAQKAQQEVQQSGDGSAVTNEDTAEEKAAEQLEASHVHAVYDAIASHFSATRFAIWPKVREFIAALPPGAVVADVGCGNGKYFGVRNDIMTLGSDRSAGLAEVASRRLIPNIPGRPLDLLADVLQADGLQLPYRTGSVDGVLCIAVLHHISSIKRRIAMLTELLRVLRPGGRALVTVWALEQEEPHKTLNKWTRIAANDTPGMSDKPQAAAIGEQSSGQTTASNGTDYMVPWHLPFHRAAGAAAVRSAVPAKATVPDTVVPSSSANVQSTEQEAHQQGSVQSNDQLVLEPRATGVPHLGPSKAQTTASIQRDKEAVVFQRYYHLFPEGELDGLVQQIPGCRLVQSFYDKSNWCVVYEKL